MGCRSSPHLGRISSSPTRLPDDGLTRAPDSSHLVWDPARGRCCRRGHARGRPAPRAARGVYAVLSGTTPRAAVPPAPALPAEAPAGAELRTTTAYQPLLAVCRSTDPVRAPALGRSESPQNRGGRKRANLGLMQSMPHRAVARLPGHGVRAPRSGDQPALRRPLPRRGIPTRRRRHLRDDPALSGRPPRAGDDRAGPGLLRAGENPRRERMRAN